MHTGRDFIQRLLAGLATGGITCGVFGALSYLNFAEFFTSFLSTWLSVIVTLLLGGDLDALFNGGISGLMG